MNDERQPKPRKRIRSYDAGNGIWGIEIDPTVTKEEEEARLARICGVTVEEYRANRERWKREQEEKKKPKQK